MKREWVSSYLQSSEEEGCSSRHSFICRYFWAPKPSIFWLQAIIKASRLPLSIIIVGIGPGDPNFDSMVELDADKTPLWMDGEEAERDIVQFVAFNDFFTQRGGLTAKTLLSKEVLAEVPKQLVTYMASHHFAPKTPPILMSDDSSGSIPPPIMSDELSETRPPPYCASHCASNSGSWWIISKF